jgi:O-antigen/teichoic acid export membrane protein
MLHLGRNILSLVTSRVLSAVILFLVYTRLTDYLGAEGAGQYGLLASYLTVFNFFVDLGMSQLVIKKMSEDKEKIGKYLSTYFVIQTILAVIFMLIMDLFVYFAEYPQFLKNALYITSLGLFLTSITLPFRTVIIASQNLTITAKVNFFNSLINAGMMFSAVYFELGIFFLAFIASAISIFDLIVYGIFVQYKLVKFKLEFDREFIKQLFIATLPFTLLTFFSIYNRIDGLLLPHLRNFTEAGYYSAAYKIWDILAYFPAVIGITLYPFFAGSITRGLMDQVKIGLETYSRYMIAIAVPLTIGSFILSEQLATIFGDEFAPAAPAVWLLVMGVSILFIYSPANSLIVSQRTRTATKVTGINLLFNLTANLIFIPKYGFVAAALITSFSELIQFLAYTYIIKKNIIQYTVFSNFIKPLIAGTVMAAVLYFVMDKSILISVPIAGLIYFLTLGLLKFFHREDWELFKTAANFRKPVAIEEQLP